MYKGRMGTILRRRRNFWKGNYENGTIKDYFDSMIAKIGENLILSDLLIKENKNSYVRIFIFLN